MAPDKSFAAEIEAVMKKHVRLNGREKWDEPYYSLIGFPEAAAEIADLQSRAFEDGARWMRERAVEVSRLRGDAISRAAGDEWAGGYSAGCRHSAVDIAALPSQPEERQNA